AESRAKLRFIYHTHRSSPAVSASKVVTELSPLQIQLLDTLWTTMLDLGRVPVESELDNVSELVNNFGSYRCALKAVKARYETDKLSESAVQRRNELLVILSINHLRKTKHPLKLDTRLQNDIAGLFGGPRSAHLSSLELIASLRQERTLQNAVEQACEHG